MACASCCLVARCLCSAKKKKQSIYSKVFLLFFKQRVVVVLWYNGMADFLDGNFLVCRYCSHFVSDVYYGIFDNVGSQGIGITFTALLVYLKIQFLFLSTLHKRC